MTLNLQEVARAIGADSHLPPLEITGWSVDTRTQNPGDVYFALRGPNHDGHDFLAAAAEKGASAVVVESPVRASRGCTRRRLCHQSNWSSPIPSAPSKPLRHGRARSGVARSSQ